MMNGLRDQLQEICERHSIDDIADCTVDSLEHKEITGGILEILPSAKSIIVLLKRIPKGMIKFAHDALYQEAASHAYDSLCATCEEIVTSLEHRNIPVKWAGLQKTPHQKYIAVKAGLGFIGDSKLLISSRYGVDVHLETVIVGENLRIPLKHTEHFRCNACGLCIEACPAEAIGLEGVDRERCLQYRRTKVEPNKGKNYCGLCMKICPQKENA